MLTIILIAIPAHTNAQVLSLGEEFRYSVTWMGLGLGTLESLIEDTLRVDGGITYKTRFIAASNPKIPFISVKDSMYSHVDENFFSRYFILYEWTGEEGTTEEYIFDYTSGRYDYSMWIVNSRRDTLRREGNINPAGVQDGVSGLFLIRQYAGTDTTFDFPTFIDGVQKWTQITASSKPETIELPKNKTTVSAYRVIGKAKYNGFRGFSGDWIAFFTADDRRIPVYGELDVFVGHVKVEIHKRDFPKINN